MQERGRIGASALKRPSRQQPSRSGASFNRFAVFQRSGASLAAVILRFQTDGSPPNSISYNLARLGWQGQKAFRSIKETRVGHAGRHGDG